MDATPKFRTKTIIALAAIAALIAVGCGGQRSARADDAPAQRPGSGYEAHLDELLGTYPVATTDTLPDPGLAALPDAGPDTDINMPWWDCSGDSSAVTATLKDRQTLIFRGKGKIKDYSRLDFTTAVIRVIPPPWHDFKDSITAVVIEDGVTWAEPDMFNNYAGLTSVTIPKSMTGRSFRAGSLSGCGSLRSITAAEDSPFYSSEDGILFSKAKDSLIIYPGGKTDTSYAVPHSVVNVKAWAFRPPALTSITVAEDNPRYASEDGVLFNKAKDTLVRYPPGRAGAYTVPASVVYIGANAFEYAAGLTSVIIPGNVKRVEHSAFDRCSSLTSVTIEDGVVSISYAFDDCPGLTSLTLPRSVTYFGGISGSPALTSIAVAAGNPRYSSADGVLFSKAKDTLFRYPPGKAGAYAIPRGVVIIQTNAFSECARLTSVTIPRSVDYIHGYMLRYGSWEYEMHLKKFGAMFNPWFAPFLNCPALTSITADANNRGYSSENGVLFDKGKKVLIRYPEGRSGEYAIPGSVNIITENAFVFCHGLTSVTIHGKVEKLEESAFAACDNLTSVYVLRRYPPDIAHNSFGNIRADATLYVPKRGRSNYTGFWRKFKNIEPLPEELEEQ